MSSYDIILYMKLIAQVKLMPTAAQADALLRTLEAANAACDTVSALAWNTHTFKKFDLQKLCYLSIRETYGLPKSTRTGVDRTVCTCVTI